MNFSFTDEQNLLRESVEKLVAAEYPFEVRRELAASEAGFSHELWRKFAELGWLGLGVPEDAGGLGGGPVETAVVMEALGAGLAVEPFLATVVVGGSLLKRGGAAQHARLARLSAGELQLAFAFAERQSSCTVDRDTSSTRAISESFIPAKNRYSTTRACRSLRAVTDLEGFGERQITVDCDVLQADGGTRTAAITGGWVALHRAFGWLIERGEIDETPLAGQVAAVSCGIYAGETVLDLDYAEDSACQADANFVLSGDGGLIEVQATAEDRPFAERQFDALLALAKKGIGELCALQRAAVG